MSALSSLMQELTTGKMTRRQFLERASALGLSASFAGLLAAQPEAVFAQGTPAASPEASPVASPTASPVASPGASPAAGGPPGPAADVLGFSAFNVDQAPKNIQAGDMDLYLFGLKTAG